MNHRKELAATYRAAIGEQRRFDPEHMTDREVLDWQRAATHALERLDFHAVDVVVIRTFIREAVELLDSR